MIDKLKKPEDFPFVEAIHISKNSKIKREDIIIVLKLLEKIKLITGQCETEKKKGKNIYLTRCIFLDDNDNCLLNFDEKTCIKFFGSGEKGGKDEL